MSNGSSQGLFIVVAIVIFGIFVGMSYTVFGEGLSYNLVNLFSDATEQSSGYLNGEDNSLVVDGVTYKDYTEYYKTFTPNDESDFIFDEEQGMITEYIGQSKKVVIPNKIKGVPVKKIFSGGYATSTNELGMSTYSRGAFESKKLTSVVLPDTLVDIIDANPSINIGGAFQGNLLTKIVFPDTLSNIGDSAFIHNGLEELILPESLKTLGGSSFYGNNLVKVTLPKNLLSIGSNTFRNNKIEKIVIPNSVVHIGNYAFSGNNIKELSISNSLKVLNVGVFSDNEISVLTLPKSIHEISSYSFMDNNIKDINYTLNSVKTIGTGAFRNNPIESAATTHPINFLVDEEQEMITEYIGYSKSVVIPNKIKGVPVKKIFSGGYVTSTNELGMSTYSRGAFESKKLTSVVLPNNLEEITDAEPNNNIGGAFQGNKLTSLDIPSSVKYIGIKAFFSNNLEEIIIPDSVEKIGSHAFNSNNLEKVTLPKSLISIDSGSFRYNMLTEVLLGKDTTTQPTSFDANVNIIRLGD